MCIDAADASILVTALSPDRLKKLIEITNSTESAIILHQDTLRLGGTLMSIIATVEISLRNIVSENLRAHFGVTNWLQQPPITFRWRDTEVSKIKTAIDSAKRAGYAKLTQGEKSTLDTGAYPNGRPPKTSHAQRAKKRRDQIQVSDGQVIAELTLFFWKRLYGPEYEHSLWRPTLKRTFPDKSLARGELAKKLEQIYQARNRLAHHEPVLFQRFIDTMSAIDFVTQRLGVPAPSEETQLARLLRSDISRIRSAEAELRDRIASFRAG